jgi:hypothetical protein
MNRQKRPAAANKTSTGAAASTPAVLFACGLAHLQRGRLLEAASTRWRSMPRTPTPSI